MSEYAPAPPGAPPMLNVAEENWDLARLPIRDRLLTLEDLGRLPPVKPLVAGLLYRGTLAQLSGPPGSYKSFLSLGMACAVALGENWEGHAVPEPGVVIYVAPEGANGIRARVLAWCLLSGIDPALLDKRLLFLPEPVQLGNALDVDEAMAAASDLDAALVVLDTRARCTVGLEENSATEQGRAIHAAERIQRASGASVLAVHHAGRAGNHGRGSNAWDGAIWSDLQVSGGDLRAQIHCAKHKDVPDGCEHHFRLVPYTVPEEYMPGADLQARSTLVVVQNGHLDMYDGGGRSTDAVLDIARTSAGIEGLTRSEIVRLAEDRNVARSTAYAAVAALVNRGALRNVGSEARPRYIAVSVSAGYVEPL